MSSGTELTQTTVLEGVIIDEGVLKFTAGEQQRFVNLTHAMVFLKRDAYLAELCAKKAHHLMREHLRECFRSLMDEVDIHSDVEYRASSE